MATLAPKLPYTHPFAGGFPYRGSQRLPSDPDALTYLAAVAAADGAPVEVGVATAVDDFFKGCKADPSGTPGRSNWDAIKASCILAGARTLAGALVPLKTPYGPELWDGTQTLESIADSGTDGAYNAATQTMTNTTGTAAAYPRFRFALSQNLLLGKRYRISGRLSGDLSAVFRIRPRNSSGSVSVDASTGLFDGTVLQDAASTALEILLNAAVQSNISVTIEDMSVREDSLTPTNNNFVDADYNRETGLKGNGSTKYLDSNRANDADPQDDQHIAVYATAAGTTGSYFGAEGGAVNGATHLALTGGDLYSRNRNSAADVLPGAGPQTGLLSFSRGSSANYQYRFGSLSGSFSRVSQTPSALNVFVFERRVGSGLPPIDARLAFYSIGESISDLALLDTRVTALVTAIGAAL